MLQLQSKSIDCTLPITWATENGKAVDVFIIVTNNPLWTDAASPVEPLRKHREVRLFIHVFLCGKGCFLKIELSIPGEFFFFI